MSGPREAQDKRDNIREDLRNDAVLKARDERKSMYGEGARQVAEYEATLYKDKQAMRRYAKGKRGLK